VLKFERAIALLSLSGHNPSRGRRRKLFTSLYNYHGPNTVLALERAVTDRFSLSDHKPISFGRRRKLPEPYIITVRAVLALKRAAIIYHCPITTHLWRRRRSYCFVSLALPP
jgi:hypothetical protein